MDSDTAIEIPAIVATPSVTQDYIPTLRDVHSIEEPLEAAPTNPGSIIANQEECNTAMNEERFSASTREVHASSECVVCGSGEDEVAIPTMPATDACEHESETCLDCLRRIIETSISTGAFISGIPCPSLGCGQTMTYFDVQKWAEPEIFQRYDTLLFQNSLRSDSTWVWCVSPNCEAGQEHTGGEASNIVTCHACGSKMCFRHQSIWHEGMSCAQWDDQLAIAEHGERWTDEWILTETKGCPNCKARILKNEGCDHMTCKKPGGCGHQFCWECLAPWDEIVRIDNSRHYDNCRYYAGAPGGHPTPQGLTNRSRTERRRSIRAPIRDAVNTVRPIGAWQTRAPQTARIPLFGRPTRVAWTADTLHSLAAPRIPITEMVNTLNPVTDRATRGPQMDNIRHPDTSQRINHRAAWRARAREIGDTRYPDWLPVQDDRVSGEDTIIRSPTLDGEQNPAGLPRPRAQFMRDLDPPATLYHPTGARSVGTMTDQSPGRREVFTTAQLPNRAVAQQDTGNASQRNSFSPRLRIIDPPVIALPHIPDPEEIYIPQTSSRTAQTTANANYEDYRNHPRAGIYRMPPRPWDTVQHLRPYGDRASLDEGGSNLARTDQTAWNLLPQGAVGTPQNSPRLQGDAGAPHSLGHRRQTSAPSAEYRPLQHSLPPARDQIAPLAGWQETPTAALRDEGPPNRLTELAVSTGRQDGPTTSDSQREVNSTHSTVGSWLRKQISPMFGTRQPVADSIVTPVQSPSTSTYQITNPRTQANRLVVIPARRPNVPEIDSYI